MANNKGKNTSVAKPRRYVVGAVLSCLQSVRRRQSKAPQVLERSLATTVRRGSGRKTVPLDVEVEMASTSAGGGGEIKEGAAGEEGAEITHALEDQHQPVNMSLDESPALPKQEMEQITPPITHGLGSESMSSSNTPSLCVTDEKADDLGSASTLAEDQRLANRSLNESPALPKQEIVEIAPSITQELGSESISLSNAPSLCVTEEKAQDLGIGSAVAEDQHLINSTASKSMDQSWVSSKQEVDQNTEDLSSKSTGDLEEKPTSSNLGGSVVSPLPSQLFTENTGENTMVENATIVSVDQPINGHDNQKSMDQSLKQEMGRVQDPSGKSMAKLVYDPTLETPTSSNTTYFDASPALPLPPPPSIPLLHSSLPTENIDQNTEELAGKPPEQYSDSWKQTMDLATPTTLRDASRIGNPFNFLDSKLVRSTSTHSRRLSHPPTIPYPSLFPPQFDDQLLAGNTGKKAVDFAEISTSDMPVLPVKQESSNNIGEKSKALMKLNVSTKEEADRRSSSEVPLDIVPISSSTSSPFSLSRKFLPWMNGESSPYGYLLLVPIGVAIIFLALLSTWGILLFFLTFGAAVLILFAVGVFALSAFAAFAVTGTATVSVWAGTLWAMWLAARTGLVITKFLITMVSSAVRATMAVDV